MKKNMEYKKVTILDINSWIDIHSQFIFAQKIYFCGKINIYWTNKLTHKHIYKKIIECIGEINIVLRSVISLSLTECPFLLYPT